MMSCFAPNKNSSIQYVRRITLTILIISIAAFWLFRLLNRVYASHLIESSSISRYATDVLENGESLHYFTRVYKRFNSELKEPLDPYHQAILPFYQNDRIVEKWITVDGFHELERIDNTNMEMVGERILTPTGFSVYDNISGIATRFAKSADEINSAREYFSDGYSVSQTSEIAQSEWGTKATQVKFDLIPVTDSTAYDIQDVSLAEQSPYAADLKFSDVQWIMQIDEITGLLITKKLVAITDLGEIILYAETNTRPEIISLEKLSFKWDEFITPDASLSLAKMTESSFSNVVYMARHYDKKYAVELMGATEDSLDKVVSGAEYDVYLFQFERLGKLGLNFDTRRVYMLPTTNCYRDRLAFNLSFCGAPIVAEYTFSQDLSKGITVSMGPSKDIVPKLKQALPGWTSSKLHTVNIAGNELEAWILSPTIVEGMSSLVFEREETFVQINGYNLSEDNLFNLASQLDIVKVNEFDNLIYFPVIR